MFNSGKPLNLYLIIFIITSVFTACTTQTTPEIPIEEAFPLEVSPAKPPLSRAEKALAQMSLEEKVGQLFFLSIRKDNHDIPIREVTPYVESLLKDIQPGGIILFSSNFRTPQQTWDLTRALQQRSPIPLFIGVDEEGGVVSRLSGQPGLEVTEFPNMAKVGFSGDPRWPFGVGMIHGKELSSLGINMNMAPVADVNNFPNNPIGLRAFHWDAQKAAPLVGAYVRGIQSQGVASVLKHFPGHGSTSHDSHNGSALSKVPYETLKKREWIPFKAGIEAGSPFVMMGHLSNYDLDERGLPGTFSHKMVELLRKDLDFQGLIITDALDMGAISSYYPAEQVAYLAYAAGMDQILMPQKPRLAYNYLLKKFQEGELPLEELDRRVLRVLQTKEDWGLFSPTQKRDFTPLNAPGHQRFLQELLAQ